MSASLIRILVEVERIDPSQKEFCEALRLNLDDLVWREANQESPTTLYLECIALAHEIFRLAKIFPDDLKIAGMDSSYIVKLVEEITGDLLPTGDLPLIRTSDIPPVLDDDDDPN